MLRSSLDIWRKHSARPPSGTELSLLTFIAKIKREMHECTIIYGMEFKQCHANWLNKDIYISINVSYTILYPIRM